MSSRIVVAATDCSDKTKKQRIVDLGRNGNMSSSKKAITQEYKKNCIGQHSIGKIWNRFLVSFYEDDVLCFVLISSDYIFLVKKG
jgi:hypothetical protein